MDWYLSGGNPAAATDLRHQVRDYLNRHSKSGSDIGDAELIVQELVANALEHATGPVWVHLSWLADQPELVVRDLGPGFAFADHMTRPHIPVQGSDAEAGVEDLAPGPLLPDPFAEGGRGLFLATHLAPQLEVAARRGGASAVAVRLPVVRAPSRSIDPLPMISDALPLLEEANPEGGFGRESFLGRCWCSSRKPLNLLAAQIWQRMPWPESALPSVARWRPSTAPRNECPAA